MNLSNSTFFGYKRENGRIGVRNHVIILPVDDLSNAAAEAVANNIKGTLAIPHPYGRLQFGADLDLHGQRLGFKLLRKPLQIDRLEEAVKQALSDRKTEN